ncbi:hypothetical protein L208DRAFT_1377822 [Tricholoma matsutake]|nr:hypothetical protein L208DRAFT_1377822 [Tricholoma matsutake 945]
MFPVLSTEPLWCWVTLIATPVMVFQLLHFVSLFWQSKVILQKDVEYIFDVIGSKSLNVVSNTKESLGVVKGQAEEPSTCKQPKRSKVEGSMSSLGQPSGTSDLSRAKDGLLQIAFSIQIIFYTKKNPLKCGPPNDYSEVANSMTEVFTVSLQLD